VLVTYLSVFLSICLSVCLSVCCSLWNIGYMKRFVSPQFLNLRQSVGLLGRGISPTQDRYLHRTTQTQNKGRQTSIPWVGFDPKTPALERAKTFYASNRAATVICARYVTNSLIQKKQSVCAERADQIEISDFCVCQNEFHLVFKMVHGRSFYVFLRSRLKPPCIFKIRTF
jgi:hypothetical protein